MSHLSDNIDIENKLPLASERLLFRKPVLDDIDMIFDACQYPGFNEGLSWSAPEEKAELNGYIQHARDSWQNKVAFAFTIVLMESDLPIGRIVTRPAKSSSKDTWNIGFWIHPKFQKKGFASEAIKTIIEFSKTSLGATRIEAEYIPSNLASQKVLNKIGFTHKGSFKNSFTKRGVFYDSVTVQKLL